MSGKDQIMYYNTTGGSGVNLKETVPGLSEINVQSVHAGNDFSVFVSQEQTVHVMAHSSRAQLNSVLGFHPADAFRVGELYALDYLNYKIKRGGLTVRILLLLLLGKGWCTIFE